MKKIRRIKIATCGLIWEETFSLMARYPKIFLPYSVLILLEICLLIFLFLAPLSILSPLVEPPIRVFFGEKYLHYPYNFVLLPTIFDYCDVVLVLIFAPLISGMTVGMVYQTQEGNKPKFCSNFLLAIKKYLILIGLWMIVTILVFSIFHLGKFLVSEFYTDEMAEFIHIRTWRMARLIQYFCFFLTLLIETFFAFCIPAVMIENKKILSSIKRSFKISSSLFLPTFILICVPTIFNSIIVLIKQKMLIQLMDRFFPEVVFIIMGVEFCIYLITQVLRVLSLTLVFLINRELSAD
ncbi:MAG: hypothetical protein AB1567_12825 [bacterium]